MWQQQQQTYSPRDLSSRHGPQQQTLRPGIIDDHAHHHHQQQQHHRAAIGTMDLPVPSNPRASRNMAEKQRRDNLNTNISTMAALLPIVAGSSRRMDKISILRLAAAFLRTQYTLGRGSANFLPRQLNEFDLEQYFVDQLIGNRGFFLVVTTTGKVVYVSRQVEQHLGHAQNELLGQSLYNFVHSEDHDVLTRNLTPEGMQPTTASSSVSIGQVSSELANDNSSNSSEDSTSHRAERIKFFCEQRRTFKIRISQRTVSRREHTQYEYLNISGILRLADACRNTESNGNRARHREMASTSNDIVFAGIASLPRSITELSIIDANKDEYVTRHLIDGRIIYCDHRVSVVAGYLSEEVSGLSAFAFMHMDDYKWTMVGLRQMYVRAVTCGSSCYRLLAKTGEFIYLRTHGYLEFDKETQTFESFVCINTLISEEEGIELIKEMKKRFSATSLGNSGITLDNIDDSSLDTSQPGKCSLEEPSRLEDAITYLISDLPSPIISEDSFSEPMPNTQFVKAAIFSARLPPAATQANKVGISKIEHYVALQGKHKQIPNIKKESNEDKHTHGGKTINCSRTEQNRISDSESTKSSGNPLSIHEMNSARNKRGNIQDNDMQSNILAIRDSSTNHCISPNHSSCLDASQGVNILSTQETIEQQTSASIEDTTCNIKVEHGVNMFGYLEKPEPALQYFDDTASDSSTVSPGSSDSHNRCLLKRICSDEDLTILRNKKRHNDAYMLSKNNDGQQSISYMNCSTFVAESGYPGITVEFNQYNEANLQPLVMTAGSSNSNLHEVSRVDYQVVSDHPVAPLVITNPSGEQFEDLQDLKNATLELDANPNIMMKMFDDFRPVTSARSCNRSKIQLTSNDQTVNAKLRRTYQQLGSNIVLRESRFDMLARGLGNSSFPNHRENLSQLKVHHKKHKKLFKNLQQTYNIKATVKHNIIM